MFSGCRQLDFYLLFGGWAAMVLSSMLKDFCNTDETGRQAASILLCASRLYLLRCFPCFCSCRVIMSFCGMFEQRWGLERGGGGLRFHSCTCKCWSCRLAFMCMWMPGLLTCALMTTLAACVYVYIYRYKLQHHWVIYYILIWYENSIWF